MMNKEEYKKELVRMWDSLRTDSENKGYYGCADVSCKKCPLHGIRCSKPINAFKMIEIVEKWAKENPPKQFKISNIEYEFLRMFIYPSYENARFKEFNLIRTLRRRGYFNGSTEDMKIKDYLDNCEVVDY